MLFIIVLIVIRSAHLHVKMSAKNLALEDVRWDVIAHVKMNVSQAAKLLVTLHVKVVVKADVLDHAEQGV